MITSMAAAGQNHPNEATASLDKPVYKRFPVIVALATALFVCGGALAALLISNGIGPTPQELLVQAQTYHQSEKYGAAADIYRGLIARSDALVDAYIGLADTELARNNPVAAINALRQGLEQTKNDPRIRERLALIEVQPKPLNERAEARPARPQGSPVQFEDPAFEHMLRIALDVDDPEPIYSGELRDVKSLRILGGTHAVVDFPLDVAPVDDGYTIGGVKYTERGEIKSLADLRHFPSLRRLTVGYNALDDLDGLSFVPALEALSVYHNEIGDISPVSQLVGLKYFYAYNNAISDLAPLEQCTNLREIWLQNNRVTSIVPLAALPKLTQLNLRGNAVPDAQEIAAQIDSLRFLELDG